MKAWLVVNEFLQSNKFSEIASWLVEAAKRQQITLEIKTNAQLLVTLGVEIEKNEEIDFVLFWDKDIRLASHLEMLGYRVFNSSQAIATCDDKSLTHLKLQQENLAMPKTILAPMTYENIGYTNHNFLKEVEETLGYPMVIKECFGSFGMQVYLAKDGEELHTILGRIGAKPMLFQEFIVKSAGRDLRLHVVGNQVVTSMYRYTDTGDFRANVTNGGKMKPYVPNELECKLAIDSCKALGLNFAGVDLLFGQDGIPVVCEVNSNAHFKNIYDCTKVNVADAIITYIKKMLH